MGIFCALQPFPAKRTKFAAKRAVSADKKTRGPGRLPAAGASRPCFPPPGLRRYFPAGKYAPSLPFSFS